MALKAGYHGIKKSLLDKLLQMSGALIIKSLGSALSLSDAGKLSVDTDGVTINVVDGKLVADIPSSGLDYELLYDGSTPVGTTTTVELLHDMDDYSTLVIESMLADGVDYTYWFYPVSRIKTLLYTGTAEAIVPVINVAGSAYTFRFKLGQTDNSLLFDNFFGAKLGNIYGLK